MFAFQGLLLALIARGRTGRGQLVDVSLLDSTAALLTYQATRVLVAGDTPARLGNRHASIAPYDTFETAEGVLVLAVGNDDQWQRFCRAAGQPALGADPRFATNALRVQHYDILQPLLTTLLRARTAGIWLSVLRPAGVPCGAVRSIEEVLADPQLGRAGDDRDDRTRDARTDRTNRLTGQALRHARRDSTAAAEAGGAYGSGVEGTGIADVWAEHWAIGSCCCQFSLDRSSSR